LKSGYSKPKVDCIAALFCKPISKTEKNFVVVVGALAVIVARFSGMGRVAKETGVTSALLVDR